MTIKTFVTGRALTALLLPLLGACGAAAAPAAPAPATAAGALVEAAAATITAADIGRIVGALAHDSTRGRDTPSPELERAAEWIAARFQGMGLQPAGEGGTFIHRWDYEVHSLAREGTHVRVVGAPYSPRYERDFFVITGGQPATEAGAFYAGRAGETGQLPPAARGRILLFDVPGPELGPEWQQGVVAAVQTAVFGGAAGLIVILDPEFPGAMIEQLAEATVNQQAPVPVVGVTDEAGRQLVAAAGHDLAALRAAGAPADLGATVRIAASRTQTRHTPPNVIAMLPGSDPALRQTYVVVTAHFDHVGVGTPDEAGDSIFNGADDNASGTAAVLEMAEAFASLFEAPARSVVFLLVSGEEKGLLGAQAWVENPTVDIEDVVANINLDMVGRNAPDTVIGIGQEYSTLEGVVQRITASHPDLKLNVVLDRKPEEMFFFRSDQLPFIKKGIPAVFFTTDVHEDYHKPSDEASRIDTDKNARVARLGFYLAHAIASDPVAPEWTPEGWRRVEEILRQSPF
ncbi:MAG TPA: M20/M25/M40 family metallo-hydrolase [Longimicrobiales bacterium]|nr:M20/M25/M40 family metallo-hydrolase [Longimicrobiales bacterium]